MKKLILFLFLGMFMFSFVNASISITNCAELENINNNLTAKYEILNDIDCSDTINWNVPYGFKPITDFNGSLEGNGKKIINLYSFNNSTGINGMGIFLRVYGNISNLNVVNVSITGRNGVGGLVAFFRNGYINNVTISGTVNLVLTGDTHGGLIGSMGASGYTPIVNNSYSSVNVNGIGAGYGGFVGSFGRGEIHNSYSYGYVESNNTKSGGFSGDDLYLPANRISNCYWDINTSNKTTSYGGTGKNTTQMQNQSTFVGWDFINIWGINPEGIDYPKLRIFGEIDAPTINLSYPTALIDYGKINGTLELNFTATDTNLDKVWYNYNGTNVTIAGAVSGVYNISNITLSTKKNVTIYANDTAGNLYSEVFGWDYRYFETNTSFNTPVLATSSQTFRLIGEKHATVTGLTARLFYDGTPRTSIVSTSGNNVNFTNSFEIPAGTATRNFFWEITATTTNGTVVFNTSTQTQTVQNITFTTCTVPTGLAYNFTTYDTTTGLPINSTFEATFSYYAAGGSGQVLAEYNYQNLSENRSNYLFCLNSSGLNVTIDAFISYGATGYDKRDYIIDDGTIGNFTVTIPLFLTQTLLTDVVTFTLEDQNYDRISGALVTVQKWNVGTNTYSTIGMFTTSSSGTGIMDLELYNTWYRAIVTINGVIVHVTDIQKLGSTDWPITINLGIQNPYDLFGTISQGLEYDNTTQIVTYSWADSSGYVNTACLTVRRPSGSGHTILYNDCVDTVAGSINYQFLLNGTYEVYGTVYLTAEYEGISQVGDFMTITIGVPEITQVSSPYGKVISFIIIGTSGLVGVSLGSPILGIFLLIGGMWGASMMGWLKGIEAIIWGIITVAIVILARQSRRGS